MSISLSSDFIAPTEAFVPWPLFISAWCFALPLCLVQSMGFLVVPLTSVVVWALFGLREIGSLIENPFQRSLQLRIVSDSIRSDVNRILLEGSTGSTLPPELRA